MRRVGHGNKNKKPLDVVYQQRVPVDTHPFEHGPHHYYQGKEELK